MRYTFILLCLTRASLAHLNETVDLGYGFDEHTLYWMGMPTFNLSVLENTDEPFYFMAKNFSAAEHGGTHLDAPYHFNPNGWKVADIPLDRLIVSGVVVEMREAAMNDSDTEVIVKDLEDWESTHGPLPDPVAIIFDFGWASKYPNKTAYFGIREDNDNDIHFPGVSQEAAEWLAKSGKVVGVGVDTPSIDPGVNKEFNAHRVLTAANLYLMENLALADADLPPRGFQLIVMPMKIVNGSGAPLRIVARAHTSSAIPLFSRLFGWIVSLWITFINAFK